MKSINYNTTIDNPLCKYCGSEEFKLGKGTPPHSASLRCAKCDRWIKWIGKAELKARLSQIQALTRLMGGASDER